MLTRAEARKLLLTRLKHRAQEEGLCVVVEEHAIERPFGWVFFVVVPTRGVTGRPKPAIQGPVIVNKHVEQVVATSIDYAPERFVEIYESLLAENRASGEGWCLTLSFPIPRSTEVRSRRVAEKAKEAGFYELR